jgi:hypothetical protein
MFDYQLGQCVAALLRCYVSGSKFDWLLSPAVTSFIIDTADNHTVCSGRQLAWLSTSLHMCMHHISG